MPYEFHDDVSVADIAFSASGKTLDQLFVAGATATFDAMADLSTVEAINKRAIAITSPTIEKLFFKWIEELIFLKDADYMVFCKFKARVTEKDGKWTVQGEAWGERIEPEKQVLKVDVKAITYHHFEVRQSKTGWEAFVILDI